MNDRTEQEIIELGEQAQNLMNQPLVKEALADCKLAIHSVWSESEFKEDREKLWFTLQGLDQFEKWFAVAIEGKDIVKQIQEERKQWG